MKPAMLILVLACGCEVVDQAARRPGALKQASVVEVSREESILHTYFTEEFAQKKIAHLALFNLADFESVTQPRPRIDDILSSFGAADSLGETDLSPFGVSGRALVYRFGRLGLATPINQTGGEVFWILISADSTTE